MNPVEYVFSIDAFTPDTLPMARLAEYLNALAKMLGNTDHIHFVRLDEGSAMLVHKVDAVDAPKVEARLNNVRLGSAPKEALAARKLLNDLLANDNAIGTLNEVATGRVVLPFEGRNREKPLAFPPFREDTTVEGQVVSVGGRDSTAHAILQDGDTFHVDLTMKREIAQELAKRLYGKQVRLYGNGRFERQPDGVWKMDKFRVERFEDLIEQPIAEALTKIREITKNSLMNTNAYRELGDFRDNEDDGL